LIVTASPFISSPSLTLLLFSPLVPILHLQHFIFLFLLLLPDRALDCFPSFVPLLGLGHHEFQTVFFLMSPSVPSYPILLCSDDWHRLLFPPLLPLGKRAVTRVQFSSNPLEMRWVDFVPYLLWCAPQSGLTVLTIPL